MAAGGGSTRVPEIHPDYQRFDTIGLNYRMSDIQAEIGLRKLKAVLDLVWTRQEIGLEWQSVLGCRLQPHDYDAENTFYSAAWPLPDEEQDWKNFHKTFCALGGDGFYAMPQVPYNEPALTEYKGLEDNSVALDLQKRLVLFKTHYGLDEAKRQADILEKVLHGAKAVKV
jgi:dTDP-4-amino-4,6-dideoxygalactose transaminase